MNNHIGALINLLFPLIFFASIGFIVYGIVLFIQSFDKKSLIMRRKAIRLIVIPILYIGATLSIFAYRNQQKKQNLLKTIPGVYLAFPGRIYSSLPKTDSCFQIVINADKKFEFINPFNPDSTQQGIWNIQPESNSIHFLNQNQQIIWIAKFREDNFEKALIFADTLFFYRK